MPRTSRRQGASGGQEPGQPGAVSPEPRAAQSPEPRALSPMLFPFFQWCEASTVGSAIRESLWAFAVIESIHLLGLAAIGGAVLVVDLRMLGIGLRNRPIADLARSAHPWFVGSLAVMLVTGVGLFLSE